MKRLTLPDYMSVKKAIMLLFEQLFPRCSVSEKPGHKDNGITAEGQLIRILRCVRKDAENISVMFFEKLGDVKEQLLRDAKFILESDPAATGMQEVIAIYPGFFAIFCYRVAHLLSELGVQLLPRMITEYAHRVSGIDIHPGAIIDCPFSIDHGTGIVIGETTQIGHHVKMYQGVTLGALSVDKELATKKRHPTIENNVILYAGCTILGGETVVGENSIIGGNVWLTNSIAPNSTVYHKSETRVLHQKKETDIINFVI